jgi:hypothetical protein
MDHDLARSRDPLDEADPARPGRVADGELEAFFARNPRVAEWRDRVRIIAPSRRAVPSTTSAGGAVSGIST